MNGPEQPAGYQDLAILYDELVGFAAFDCWRKNFERLANRYEIRYGVAADVACGTGLAAAYMSERCRRVYAVDGSESMLEVARRRVDPRKVTLLEQRFDTLDLPRQVDLITCNFDSLNYILCEGELQEALHRFRLHLEPKGYAVFDMNTTRELLFTQDQDAIVHRLEGGFSIWESDYDPEKRISTIEMTNFVLLDDGNYRMTEELHRERAYDLEVILEMLGEAGFARVWTFDARGLSEVAEDTRRVQFLARA